MFKELELEHSLYDIKIEKLSDFKNLASHFLQQRNTILQHATLHNELDNYAIVLNVWLFLQENRENIFFISDKMMPYASNFYVFEQLRRNEMLKEHQNAIEYSDKYAFILSYFLSEEIIIWAYEALKLNEKTAEIMHINRKRDYFKLASDHSLANDETHSLYIQQKYVTKALATNIATSGDFNRAIKEGIKKATRYLSNSPIIEKDIYANSQK